MSKKSSKKEEITNKYSKFASNDEKPMNKIKFNRKDDKKDKILNARYSHVYNKEPQTSEIPQTCEPMTTESLQETYVGDEENQEGINLLPEIIENNENRQQLFRATPIIGSERVTSNEIPQTSSVYSRITHTSNVYSKVPQTCEPITTEPLQETYVEYGRNQEGIELLPGITENNENEQQVFGPTPIIVYEKESKKKEKENYGNEQQIFGASPVIEDGKESEKKDKDEKTHPAEKMMCSSNLQTPQNVKPHLPAARKINKFLNRKLKIFPNTKNHGKNKKVELATSGTDPADKILNVSQNIGGFPRKNNNDANKTVAINIEETETTQVTNNIETGDINAGTIKIPTHTNNDNFLIRKPNISPNTKNHDNNVKVEIATTSKSPVEKKLDKMPNVSQNIGEFSQENDDEQNNNDPKKTVAINVEKNYATQVSNTIENVADTNKVKTNKNNDNIFLRAARWIGRLFGPKAPKSVSTGTNIEAKIYKEYGTSMQSNSIGEKTYRSLDANLDPKNLQKDYGGEFKNHDDVDNEENKTKDQKDDVDNENPNQIEEIETFLNKTDENVDLEKSILDNIKDNKIPNFFMKCFPILNIIPLVLSLVVFIFSIAELSLESLFYAVYNTNTFLHALNCLIAFSVLFFLLSLSGIFSFANWKNSFFYYYMLFYVTVLSVCLILNLASVSCAGIFIFQLERMMETSFKNFLMKEYDQPSHELLTKNWDDIQQNFKCCAIEDNGYTFYQTTSWFEKYSKLPCYDAKYVPVSCCHDIKNPGFLERCQSHCTGPPRIVKGENEHLIKDGCFPKVRDHLKSHALLVIFLNLLSMLFCILVILAFFLPFVSKRFHK